jgi:hypothetical protein
MFELQNRTLFVASLLPAMEVDGGDAVQVIIKGTWALLAGGRLERAGKQIPLVLADEYYGEPAVSSLRCASDLAPEKRGTDIVLSGSAHAPDGDTTEVDVTLEAGPLRKTVRVFGDRRWSKSLFSASFSKPKPFDKMPLKYELAFGGTDQTHKKESQWAFEPRNPVGQGLIANPSRDDFGEVPLPNLEDPSALMTRPQDRPTPTGFGFIAPNWEPRKKYAGTYDDVWLNSRCPLLPTDFDPRFYNAAHPDLINKEFFKGGEPVRVINASKNGTLEFKVPKMEVIVEFYIDGKATKQACNLDTVVIEPDAQRLQLTWRTKIRCHRKIKYVTGAKVTSTERKI